MDMTRDKILQAIDELSDASLYELDQFIAYLRFKEHHKDSDWMADMYEAFAPVRDAIAETGMTETEINAIIDDAVDEVRNG
jgi:hypothetical protein